MHVALVTVFPRDLHRIDGGVAGAARYLVEELAKHPDLKVTVIALESRASQTVPEQWENVTVCRLGKRRSWRVLPGTLYYMVTGKRRIRSLLKQINPDIVHFQGSTFLATNCKQPSILTIHGIAEEDAKWDDRWGILHRPRRLLLKFTEAYARRRVSHVVLISEYARRFLPAQNRIRKTWLIENSVAESYFHVERVPEPGKIFCCARIRPLKNTLGMIRAFALLVRRFPNAHLRIAGTPEAAYLDTCKQQVQADGLQDRVNFLGSISIDEVQLELSKANCLVVPSFQENAPLTIAEAMAVGVPVVAASVGGIPEMIEDGKTGLLVDPHDPRSICEAVSKILSDETLAHSMGQSAKETAEKRFTASLACEKTLQAYREILEAAS
ncbi:MAG: glycosyltransferase family 4 protein [Sedimentisphaerales bacterium]|jgi:glycosyltransferase involved in cell wall biosynthesis